MNVYRVTIGAREPVYAGTMAEARKRVKLRRADWYDLRVDLVSVASDKTALLHLLNGDRIEADNAPALRRWMGTARGGLKPCALED